MFDHEKLDVYRVSIDFAGWSHRLCSSLKGQDRHARDQLLRASQSISLNIAEGNGKLPSADRRRYLRSALGSALECAVTLDVLAECNAISRESALDGKRTLKRIVAMLTKLSAIAAGVQEVSEIEYVEDNE